jgi:hypothetical protein
MRLGVVGALLCLAGCHSAAKQSDDAWRAVGSGGWLMEEPDGAQRLSVPMADGTTPESGVVNVLSALVHGPDPAETRRSDKRVHVSPMPVASSRGLGFRLTVRW